MKEQRRLPRRHLIYYLRIFDNTSDKLLGHLVDLNSEGIMTVGEEFIKPKTPFTLKMSVPEDISNIKTKEITFKAESIWCKNDINKQFYDTGFKIIGAPPQYLNFFDELIKEFVFDEG